MFIFFSFSPFCSFVQFSSKDFLLLFPLLPIKLVFQCLPSVFSTCSLILLKLSLYCLYVLNPLPPCLMCLQWIFEKLYFLSKMAWNVSLVVCNWLAWNYITGLQYVDKKKKLALSLSWCDLVLGSLYCNTGSWACLKCM